MTLEQALLAAISTLTIVVGALWRKSVKDEELCRKNISSLHEQIYATHDRVSAIWKELHYESVKVMQDMIKTSVESTQVLNALHKRLDSMDLLRVDRIDILRDAADGPPNNDK